MSKLMTAIALSLSFFLLLLLPVTVDVQGANPAVILQATPLVPPVAGPQVGPGISEEIEGQVHGLYFYSEECAHCEVVYKEVIQPLQAEYGSLLDLRLLKIDNPDDYELLIEAEEIFGVQPKNRGLPTTILGDKIIIGEEDSLTLIDPAIRQAIEAGGLNWPAIPGLDPASLNGDNANFANPEICTVENPEACETDAPIYAVYFYQTGCQSCSRVEADLNYLRSRYPQLIIKVFNIYDNAGLADWLTKKAGRSIKDLHTPALFIADEAWFGEEEITPAVVEDALLTNEENGTTKIWEIYDPSQSGLEDLFKSMSWAAVVFAGLVDGLNPCAFATLIFFVSYLTLSGRKGREVLGVGCAFTLGVFLAYLAVGLGFYKVLDLLGETLTVINRWVYGLTAAFCLGLAVFSLIDFFRVRKGGTSNMTLKLPEPLRKRINATIRKGRNQTAYVGGAFLTGLVVSFLELACTGQVYLPTIIAVSSNPDLRAQAIGYLVLYNLMFIVPLIVVFILAYYGTTSKDLVGFMEKHSAAVKLGMAALFLGLSAWLVFSLLLR
ncbi:MAG: cytochrome c biogenesis CcdA family protein [Anaerolineaceae bacterium]|nr:cytochrome c biogenesis CcdA family protein [Anaerolineaceae bacterium]